MSTNNISVGGLGQCKLYNGGVKLSNLTRKKIHKRLKRLLCDHNTLGNFRSDSHCLSLKMIRYRREESSKICSRNFILFSFHLWEDSSCFYCVS